MKKVMSIDDYKKRLLSIVRQMETEHGCDVSKIVISKDYRDSGSYKSSCYDVVVEV